jgi:basic membrane protein A
MHFASFGVQAMANPPISPLPKLPALDAFAGIDAPSSARIRLTLPARFALNHRKDSIAQARFLLRGQAGSRAETPEPTGRPQMTSMKSLLGAAAVLAMSATGALADGPAVVFDLGGKFDRSFNESAFNGAERWAEETGGTYREIELQNDAQREQAMRRLAEAGSNPIVMAGFSQASALEVVAPDYPDTTFVIIDGVVDAPNVQSIIFSEHEGSYLVGMMAGMASESGTVSFVGGMDIPLISRFACGYAQGAVAANPDATVIANMTGTTPAAWNDPVRGGELTRGQIGQGSDVVFAAAGGTGLGVLQTAADEGILSIGVDANQNYLHPGMVLTSMVKRVDVAVYDSFSADSIEAGIFVYGLAEDGVGFALDEFNADLVSEDMVAAVEAAQAEIIAGTLSVHNFTDDGSCPVAMQ